MENIRPGKFYFLMVLFIFFSGRSQDLIQSKPTTAVPVIVKEEFQKKFPGVEPVLYMRFRGDYDQQLRYEGKFEADGRTSLAVYDNEGVLLAMAFEIEKNEIPGKITRYMKKNYPAYPIAQSILVTDILGKITYEIGFYIDENFTIAVFGEKGKFIQLSRG